MDKETTKMIPGDELHLTMLMAPYSLNLVTGQDRQHLLAFGRAAFDAGKEAGQATPCLHQLAEPAASPFMYAIADGYGNAFFEEQGCVSSEAKDLQPEVDSLNQNLDGEPAYAVVAVYTHPAAQQAAAHPDDAAVDALAALMKAKLAEKRAKGYGGWNDKTQCLQQRLSDMLRAHVDKGDPVDVANFCAMLSARGEGIAAAPQAVQAAAPLPMVELFGVKDGQETRLGPVPMPPTMRARELLQDIGFRGLDDDDGDGAYAMAACEQLIEYCKAYYEAPAHPAEGVASEDEAFEKWWSTPHVWGLGHKAAQRSAWQARAALAATQPAAQGMDALYAARWREVLQHVGAAPHFGGQHFTLNTLQAPDTPLGFKANLMSGSAAQHFTKAIDAAIAARAEQGGA